MHLRALMSLAGIGPIFNQARGAGSVQRSQDFLQADLWQRV